MIYICTNPEMACMQADYDGPDLDDEHFYDAEAVTRASTAALDALLDAGVDYDNIEFEGSFRAWNGGYQYKCDGFGNLAREFADDASEEIMWAADAAYAKVMSEALAAAVWSHYESLAEEEEETQNET